MIDCQKIWISIPAYNEGLVIHDVVCAVRSVYSNVVVVDDCSRDNTYSEAKRAGAHVLRHAINLGQGAALQTGIDFALMHDAAAIVTFDADGQHSITDIDSLLTTQDKMAVDIVLGSRFTGTTVGMSAARRILLKAAVIYTSLTTGIKLTDAHNGLRLLTRDAARKIKITQNRMAHASEIIEQIARHKLRFAESSCTITYTEYSKQKGQSGLGAFRIIADLIIARISK